MSSTSVAGNNVDYGPKLINVLTPMVVVVTIVVAHRLISKLRRQYKIDLEDWLALTAFIQYACEMFYATTIMTIKMSILAMHWRLFPTRTTKIAYLSLGGLTLAWWLVIILVTSFKCQPLGKTFDPYIEGHCINNMQFFLGFGIPNILTDVGIMILAVHKVTHLRLPAVKRAGLSVVFVAGAGAIAASCIRLYYYCQVEIQDAEGNSADVTVSQESHLSSKLYVDGRHPSSSAPFQVTQQLIVLNSATEVDSVLWALLETDLAIICSSLASWGPIVSQMSSQIWSILSGGSSSKLSAQAPDKALGATHTIRTFGGTIVHRFPGGTARNQNRRLGGQDSKSTLKQREWFDRLSDDELHMPATEPRYEEHNVSQAEIAPNFVPYGYAADQYATAQDKAPGEECAGIPLGIINVRTVVDQEATDWKR